MDRGAWWTHKESMGPQRVGHDRATLTSLQTFYKGLFVDVCFYFPWVNICEGIAELYGETIFNKEIAK